MTNLQIIFLVIIVTLSIILPLYFSYKKRILQSRINEQIKKAKYDYENEKIRVYIDNINEKFRAKYR